MIHDHHGKPLDAPGKKWSSCLLNDTCILHTVWPLLYGVLCTGPAHANFSAFVQNARKRNAAVPMASHKWEQTVTWPEQNHHLKSVQHLVASRCQICRVGENEVFTLDTRIVPSAAWQSIYHLVPSSNMFKESVEIEFRVSESLVLALQLFPESFSCLWHTSDASTLMLSGFEGHHLINDTCIEKVCSCENGIAGRGSECPEYGSALGHHRLWLYHESWARVVVNSAGTPG